MFPNNANSLSKFVPSDSSELATWVGALGSVGAVISAIWIMNRQNLLNERNRLAEREHAASKEHQEKLDHLATCLLIAANTVSGTISSLNTLASVDDSDVPWTVTNQIAHIARVTEPTLRIPMHELGAVDAVLLVFQASSLAQRLGDSLAIWSRQEAASISYISDVRATVDLLKPEAVKLMESIERYLTQLRGVS
ncbi:hypothetical protein ACK3Z6_20000 [Aeromonas caviae]|uniref:hypothetical protein n=1 Tax=Aeromonas TaxID=642 RepID=UPI001597C8B5|nr:MULTISPECIES: hypothetical protein [Aeromonas]MDX7817129.1 hypothetical protein [Aeromonas caviae]QJT26269.1 hypothetical protein E4185_08870 [Aeromonas media]